jgi:hypothetical protein
MTLTFHLSFHITAHSARYNEGVGDVAEAGVETTAGGGLTDADFFPNWDESIETFDGMDEELLRGIYSYGFEKPSAIQQRAIKPTMLGRDLIVQAPSGTERRIPLHLLYSLFGRHFATQKKDELKLTIFRV